MSRNDLDEELTRWRDAGRRPRFWLRDDDAVALSPALEQLLSLSVPLTIATIPMHATQALADRLAGETDVDVAVHGYAHVNHASPGHKKQELLVSRGREVVLKELAEGFDRLRRLCAGRLMPMLVPPWNRIDTALIADLPSLGFRALSAFGDKLASGDASILRIDTHVDIIDWRGSRGGRTFEDISREVTMLLGQRRLGDSAAPIGILTHHLVHDETAWRCLASLIDRTAERARWVAGRSLLAG